MGSFVALIVGDWRDEVVPFLDIGYIGNPFDSRIFCADIFNKELRRDYRQSQKNIGRSGRLSFPEWIYQARGIRTLSVDDQLDLARVHRHGWVRLNEKNEVTEVIVRNPGASILYILDGSKQFLLKSGAKGWDVDPDQPEDIELTEGYVSSARLCDIDFSAMRRPKVEQASTNWHWAHSLIAGRTWTPYKDICQKYSRSESGIVWSQQAMIEELRQSNYFSYSSPSELDALLLLHGDFIDYCAGHASVLDYSEVVSDGQFMGCLDEDQLLAGLDGEARLTLLILKE